MAKNILEEAVEDVVALKRAAEENAKNLLVEAMSPQIKNFIQAQLGQEGVEAAPAGGEGAPAGNNDTAHTSAEGGEDAGDAGADEDVYESEPEDDDEIDFEDDEDEDGGDEDEEEDEDLEEDEEKPAKKPVKESSHEDSDEDEKDDDEMEESVDVTSEDLKRAFLESIRSGLKEDAGKFGDPQDPNDGEYGLAHKVPGEVQWADAPKVLRKAKHAKQVTKEQHTKVVQKLQRQLAQYAEAVKFLKKNLHEMNLFNTKLVYTTRLLQNNNLSNRQKLNVVEALDKARTKREVEFMFSTLSESFKIAGALSEGRNKLKGPKASRVMKPGSTLNEGKTQETAQYDRLAELAGIAE